MISKLIIRSMGQGQEGSVKAAIKNGVDNGYWVFL